jgi:hypothetical protein
MANIEEDQGDRDLAFDDYAIQIAPEQSLGPD